MQFIASQLLWKLQIKDNLFLHSWNSRNWLNRWLNSSEQLQWICFAEERWRLRTTSTQDIHGAETYGNTVNYPETEWDFSVCACVFPSLVLSLYRTKAVIIWAGLGIHWCQCIFLKYFPWFGFCEVQLLFLLNPFESDTLYNCLPFSCLPHPLILNWGLCLVMGLNFMGFLQDDLPN